MILTEQLTPYDEGFRARLAGAMPAENPYPQDTIANDNWIEGWKDQDWHLFQRDEALRSIGEIAARPIREPEPGEYVDKCQWSRTGWAIWRGRDCTCQPANPPNADEQEMPQ